MTDQLDVSIIMPALNEAQNIGDAIHDCQDALDQMGIKGEIIAINDGSTDQTEAKIKNHMELDPRVRLINHERPKGVGASFWDGVDNARGNFVVMLPGDNENDPMEIFRYYSLLNSVDIVIPFVFNTEVRPFFRNVLSFIYRFIINTTFLVNFHYTNGTVLYRKTLLDELEYRSDGFFFQTDILVRTVKHGYLFAEVPYRLGMRAQGVSRAITFPSLFQVIRGYLRLVRDIKFQPKSSVPKTFVEGSQTANRHQVRGKAAGSGR
ncbi:MAG: glycosyltransferase family 2 protein [Desulfobaccales bacterium]|nr:glycosyltransferase family 2 protein [Desulfobaccales bacterium]